MKELVLQERIKRALRILRGAPGRADESAPNVSDPVLREQIRQSDALRAYRIAVEIAIEILEGRDDLED